MEAIQLRQYPGQLGLKILRVLLQVGFFFLAARALTAEEFGFIALLSVFLTVSGLLSEMGFEAAIVQWREISSEEISSAFWVSFGISLAIAAGLSLLASPLERFLGMPGLHTVLIAGSIAVPLGTLQIVPRAVFLRNLSFRTVAVIETAATIVGFMVGAVCLLRGLGVFAVIIFYVSIQFLNTALLFAFSGWRPSIRLRFRLGRKFRSAGANLQSFSVLNFVGKYLDNLIIAKILGAVQLGFYDFAYRIINLQQDVVLGTMRQLVLPLYSRSQKQPGLVYRLLCRDTQALVAFSLPILTLAGLSAASLIPAIFGLKWSSTVPLFQIFSLEAARQTMTGLTTVGLISIARTDVLRNYALVSAPTLVIAFILGTAWGALGVAVCFFAANTLLTFFLVHRFRQSFEVSIKPLAIQWIPGIAGSCVAASGYVLAYRLFVAQMSSPLASLAAIVVGGILAWALLRLMFPVARATLHAMVGRLAGDGEKRDNTLRRTMVLTDPLVNEGNPHLTIVHQGIASRYPSLDLSKLKLKEFLVGLPRERLDGSRKTNFIIHFHFINRFYESESAAISILKFLRLLVVVAACRLAGVKIVWTFHDRAAHDFSFRKVEHVFLGLFVQLCDRIITFSEKGRELLWSDFGRSEGVSFTPHPPYEGVYPNLVSRIKARAALKIRRNEMLYVFVGRLMRYKGLEELVTVFRGWRPKRRVRLMILGPSRSDEFVERLRLQAADDERITISAGFIPEDKLQVYLNAADFGVLPYRQILHSGTTMLFCTFRCPVIVPSIGWFPEIFQQHEIGIMYRAEDPGGILDGLARSLNESRKKFVDGIDSLCASWSLDKAVETTANVYHSLA